MVSTGIEDLEQDERCYSEVVASNVDDELTNQVALGSLAPAGLFAFGKSSQLSVEFWALSAIRLLLASESVLRSIEPMDLHLSLAEPHGRSQQTATIRPIFKLSMKEEVRQDENQ
jgi:hypothetical protein